MILPNPKNALAFSALAISISAVSTVAYANEIQGITASQPNSSLTQLRINFNGSPVQPIAYQQAGSNQLVLDFNQVGSVTLPRNTPINTGVVNDVVALSNGNVTRLMVNLNSNVANYSTRFEGNQLVIDIADVNASRAMTSSASSTPAVSTVVQVSPLLNPANIQDNRSTLEGVTAINYKGNSAGGGDIAIDLTNEAIPVDVQRQGNKIVIRTPGSRLPRHLVTRLNAGGLVANIDGTNQGQNGLITINMSQDFEYQAYQAGNQIKISVKAADLLREPTLEEKVYTGEPLSMEFQDVSVRTVLDVLAQFTNNNIIVSDNVNGNITLRLINVPWDQALDIVLASKNLDKRVNNNVMWIGPADVLAKQEADRLKAQQDAEALMPIRTEYIRLNYAKASNIMRLITEAKNTSNNTNQSSSLLSPRGSVSVDDRTNMLIVRDTAQSIQNIHAMIAQLDIPVKQVLIEARFVKATDAFSKDLGVRWGVFMNNSSRFNVSAGSDRSISWSSSDGTSIESDYNTLAVNLGATNTAGRIALGLLNLPSMALDLELSAGQQDGRSEIISSPKVLTSDKQQAVILSGREVPYQEAAASGATTTSFKEAALRLTVTPNVTPDGKIGLDLDVTNASVVANTSPPQIQREQVTTSLVLEDGQTVVLGGIYTQDLSNSETKVPFLGDLPMVGRLFRQESRVNSKTETLIFITPKLVNDGITRIQ